MSSFNFEIVLNYAMNTCSIKPPSSFAALMEIVQEKYDLTKVSKITYYDEDDEVKVENDSDYLNMFDYISGNDLKELEMIVKSEEQKVKRKKSLRKNSRNSKPPTTSVQSTNDEGCINGI
jgi:hypothetical protein